jgi:hypothetical protein
MTEAKPVAGPVEISVGASFEAIPETNAKGPWVVIVINGQPVGLPVHSALHFASVIAETCQQVLNGTIGPPEGAIITRGTDKVQ